MRFIAIDLGETTGVVHYSDLHEVVTFVEVIANERRLEEFLQELLHSDLESFGNEWVGTKIILEEMPNLHPGSVMARAYNIIYSLSNTTTIKPAYWKPFAKAQKWKATKFKSKHVRDAYQMLRYYFFVNGIDIGDQI